MVHWVKSLLCHNHDYHGTCHNLAYLFKDNTMSTTNHIQYSNCIRSLVTLKLTTLYSLNQKSKIDGLHLIPQHYKSISVVFFKKSI